jgi:hypothetical protein
MAKDDGISMACRPIQPTGLTCQTEQQTERCSVTTAQNACYDWFALLTEEYPKTQQGLVAATQTDLIV